VLKLILNSTLKIQGNNMHLKKQFLLLFAVCAIQTQGLKSYPIDIFDRVKGCIFGGLIGDALGKPTEFINSTEKIFKKYPNGIKGFQDIKDHGLAWKNEKTGQLYAPYTDDTAMARVTLKVLLEARKKNWNLDYTMRSLAVAYVQDMDNPTGWTMPERAPGNNCLKNLNKIRSLVFDSKFSNIALPYIHRLFDGWQAGGPNDMGCGSVMRAHPFGVIFADDADKAAEWAAQHSKITHGHPSAQAACAVMASSVAHAIQGKSKEFILEQMISVAKKYDPAETHLNPYSKKEEKSTWGKIQDVLKEAYAFNAKEILYPDGFNHLDYRIHTSQHVFEKYQGWAADDAIAAAAYIFAISSDSVHMAICLGVHTPGDSDSIASMAGALVGAYLGAKRFDLDFYNYMNPTVFNFNDYEGARTLQEYANKASGLVKIN
jgi:ADP-ribosylglycohydrolase